ncbi:MAG: hypothetical protein JWP99_1350 [Devosia sp.]|jgi:hypothetical protein|nr:hypothetical protein [Devosia sp.]
MEAEAQRRPVDWEAVRIDYEARELTNADICTRFGITEPQLRYQREKHGWVSRRARTVHRADLINRMLRIFEKQLGRLEKPMPESADKEINLLSTASKTLEKLIEIQDSEQPRPAQKKDMRALRDELALRLDQLKKR